MRSHMSDPIFTICTVAYHNFSLLQENIQLTRSLNPSAHIKWLVVNNDISDSSIYQLQSECVHVIDGVPRVTKGSDRGSHHHAAALNRAIAAVDSNLCLILDPDFYIVRPRWATDVEKHLQDYNLAFFVSVWHPSHYKKYRYFPSVHCMFIDLKKVERVNLDFTPELDEASRRIDLLERIPVPRLLRACLKVGISRDTGYKIFAQYYRSLLLHDELVPVWDPNSSLLRSRLKSLIMKLLPDTVSLHPQKKGYYTPSSFLSGLSPKLSNLQCEEFFWKSSPFAFHIRGVGRASRSGCIDQGEITDAVSSFVSGISAQ